MFGALTINRSITNEFKFRQVALFTLKPSAAAWKRLMLYQGKEKNETRYV